MSYRTWPATAVPVVLLTAMTLVAGCATRRIAWEKSGVTQADRERDENTCLRTAIGSDGEILAPYCIDRELYIRCMEGRGYTVRSQ